MTPDDFLAGVIFAAVFLLLFLISLCLDQHTPRHDNHTRYPEAVQSNNWYATGVRERRCQCGPPLGFKNTSENSSSISFTYGDLDGEKVFREEKGIPVVDLHKMTRSEAIRIVNEFLAEKVRRYSRVRIITGKGLHSSDGEAKVKPAIKQLLQEKGLEYQEVSGGGCLEVTLPLSYFQ
ncbi:uncharacterized protein [Palaemon carinicauda]|uniref:uncharacterized protein n=1 Tax=Palaemon carinicauda TaxID=392227 RepID=UPI0035B678A9